MRSELLWKERQAEPLEQVGSMQRTRSRSLNAICSP